ncbi:MAG TPA: chemotaxis-specific protein-glutamate methyltransferase CheB [Nocardioides sp.]
MIRVLVVDDSATVRRLVTTALTGADGVEVVGTARDGREAVELADRLDPDVVTLDIEMPELDGLGALEEIRARRPRQIVVMFSTLTERGASATLEALSLGAADYVTKPSNVGSMAESITAVREQLVPRLVALAGLRRLSTGQGPLARSTGGTSGGATSQAASGVTPTAPRVDVPRRAGGASGPGGATGGAAGAGPAPRATGASDVLLIGSSTGGPDAVARVLADLPADLAVPVLLVQHMPPVFTTMFAQRLDKVSPLQVREAADGGEVRPGEVLVAPGDHHLEVRRVAGGPVRVALTQDPPEHYCRPAVDVLLRSALEVYGGAATVLVLTGMGADGAAGARRLRAAGARVLVQDEATSVVWGMPGAIASTGGADEVLPLDAVAPRLRSLLPSGARLRA